jgi:hypothetical protein
MNCGVIVFEKFSEVVALVLYKRESKDSSTKTDAIGKVRGGGR